MQDSEITRLGCAQCLHGEALDFDFTMAFQPIVNAVKREIFAHEALVRGLNNEPAGDVFRNVNDDNLYRFDQTCRVKAIQLAAELQLPSLLSINFMPRAVYRPERCIRTTLAAASEYGFPVERILFECTEGERTDDHSHLSSIINHYQQQGFITAIDDFGAGYSGLNLLAEFKPDVIKIDMALIRDIDNSLSKQAILRGVLQICRDLSIQVIAEGVETRQELDWLMSQGIELFQGYYFARPAFRSLAEIPANLYP